MNVLLHSMLGLPSSGKTTFLAALWHVLNANEIECNFSLDRIEGDVRYLDSITDAWRTFQKVPRTSMQMEEKISLRVKNNLTQELVTLEFPDLSGETFERLLLTRLLERKKFDTLSSSDGLLLFITADKTDDGLSILDVPVEFRGDSTDGAIQKKDWDAECVPQQVKIVELLQLIQSHQSKDPQRKIAIIISAWDVITESSPNIQPVEWLEREFPLVFQYLDNNRESFDYDVFGISAQGGEIKSAQGRNKLAEKMEASTRIICTSDGKINHDITCPILWLMARE